MLAKAVIFRGAVEQKATRALAHAAGIFLVAASTRQQYAIEVPELGHGVLTYSLLQGLGEKAGALASRADGIVTILSLLQHVNEQVPELTEKYHGGNRQYPVSFSTGMDFPLSVR